MRTSGGSNPARKQMSMKSWLGTNTQLSASDLAVVGAGNSASLTPWRSTFCHRDFSDRDLRSWFNFIQPPEDVLLFNLTIIVVHNFLQGIKHYALIKIGTAAGVLDPQGDGEIDALLEHRQAQGIGLQLHSPDITQGLFAFYKSRLAIRVYQSALVTLARRLTVKRERNC